MDSLYTGDVQTYMWSRKWPESVQWKIFEKNEPEPHLNLIFFRDNWLTLTVEEQMQVTSIVKEIMVKLWADGIPIYTGKMESQYYEQES